MDGTPADDHSTDQGGAGQDGEKDSATSNAKRHCGTMLCVMLLTVILAICSIAVTSFALVMELRSNRAYAYGIAQKYPGLLEKFEELYKKVEDMEAVTPVDCIHVSRTRAKHLNETGGVFDIYPTARGDGYEVYCDLITEGGGWTVFQRRMDGSENFSRNWTDYVEGFGERNKEFWLGLEAIHQMTKYGSHELRVELGDWEENRYHLNYGTFFVGSSSNNYTLRVGNYSGLEGDSLTFHDGSQFSTADRDNDQSDIDCAKLLTGGWWFARCLLSNLNGRYRRGWMFHGPPDGVVWTKLRNYRKYSLKYTEMKFRKV